MNFKKIILMALLLLAIFTIGSVSANENATDEINCIDDDDGLSLDNHDNLQIDEHNNPVEQAIENDSDVSSQSKETLSVTNSSEKLESYPDYTYITGVTAKWGADKKIYFGWYGSFNGFFKVFKGETCVHNEVLNGYDGEREWNTWDLDVGTYTAKLIDYDGKILDQSTIKIQKSAVKVSVKSFTATAGKTVKCYAYVTDKYDGVDYDGGYVYYKINGKTYKAKLKNGVAVLKFKVPSKAKKYTCQAIYNGDSQFNGAKKTFKMTVKKKSTAKTVKNGKYGNVNTITVTIKDGKKTIKVKCYYKSNHKQYLGHTYKYGKKYSVYVAYEKRDGMQCGKKGWHTVATNAGMSDNAKIGSGYNKYRPITKVTLH